MLILYNYDGYSPTAVVEVNINDKIISNGKYHIR